MTLSELLTGNLPYSQVHLLDVKAHILRKEAATLETKISEDHLEFVPIFNACCNTHANLRPFANQLLYEIKY
jgi:hypothetical protein